MLRIVKGVVFQDTDEELFSKLFNAELTRRYVPIARNITVNISKGDVTSFATKVFEVLMTGGPGGQCQDVDPIDGTNGGKPVQGRKKI